MSRIFLIVFVLTACQAVTLNSQVAPIFKKYIELNAQFLKAVKTNEETERKRVEAYMYHEYTDALSLLETKYCLTPDQNALDAFILVLTATPNSAYETPSLVLGKLYICQPDLIINRIHTLPPKEKKYIVHTLDWGFQNATYQHKCKIEKYLELSKRLKSLKATVE